MVPSFVEFDLCVDALRCFQLIRRSWPHKEHQAIAEESFLADDFLRPAHERGEVDLLVGIPSYNNASTIGQTLQTVEEVCVKTLFASGWSSEHGWRVGDETRNY